MRKLLEDYIIKLYRDVPISVYEGMAIVFCIGAVVMMAFLGLKKGLQYLSGLLLAEYVFLLFYKTVLVRSFNEKLGHDFHPFWSYTAIQEGKEKLILENLMNVAVFVPVGLLLGCAFRNMKWWMVLLIGGGVSVAIEAMQFVLKRGFAETDDVMHNTAGCMIGYGLYKLARYGRERIGKRFVAVL